MSYYNKTKRKCKVNFVDIELEAFIFGCFLYTWNKIYTDDVNKKKNNHNNSSNNKGKISKNNNLSHFKKNEIRKWNYLNKDTENSLIPSTNDINNNVVNRKNKKVYTNKCNSKTTETCEKNLNHDENNYSENVSNEFECKLNEEFQVKNKINIIELNKKLLYFVKSNFCLKTKDFNIFHDLYSFYTHIQEKKKGEEIKLQNNFFPSHLHYHIKSSNNDSCNNTNFKEVEQTRNTSIFNFFKQIPTHNHQNVRKLNTSVNQTNIKKKQTKTNNYLHRYINKNCNLCDILINKGKNSKYKKFIHICTKKVYGNKKFDMINKCIINIKTFDDSFIHSITIERLFSYICKENDKNLYFFWFKFLNVLFNVTINKQLMIKIFFFVCIKNLLISSYFNSEDDIANQEFPSKNILCKIDKQKNTFLTEFVKINKCGNITNIILNNNYILLQNLFDYFYIICSTRNMKFYDNFFLNVQMINFIYLIQINFFHYYYVKLYHKVVKFHKSKSTSSNTSNLCTFIQKGIKKNTIIHAKDENINGTYFKKKTNIFKPFWKTSDKNENTKENLKVKQNIDKVENAEISIDHHEKEDTYKFVVIGKHYNINKKYYKNLNLTFYNYNKTNNISSNCFEIISDRVIKNNLLPNTNETKKLIEKKLIKNHKIYFKRLYTFLNKYIKTNQLKKHSNIFSFMFDALPCSNLKNCINTILEPYIFHILRKYTFIEIYNFIESLKNLYNLKKNRRKRTNLRLDENDPTLKFLNDIQGLNYLYNDLKNDYLTLTQNLYIKTKGENLKNKKIILYKKYKTQRYNKSVIQNLIYNKKTDIYKNVAIYKFSTKDFNLQHNLFNIYIECNLLNKAYKLVIIDFDFSFSLTSEIIFLYKMYLIELKKNNILRSFEILNMTFYKCFILLKKYLCNPTSFKLLSLVSIQLCHMLYNYPFLLKYLSFFPSSKIEFITKYIIMNDNVKVSGYSNNHEMKNYFSSFLFFSSIHNISNRKTNDTTSTCINVENNYEDISNNNNNNNKFNKGKQNDRRNNINMEFKKKNNPPFDSLNFTRLTKINHDNNIGKTNQNIAKDIINVYQNSDYSISPFNNINDLKYGIKIEDYDNKIKNTTKLIDANNSFLFSTELLKQNEKIHFDNDNNNNNIANTAISQKNNMTHRGNDERILNTKRVSIHNNKTVNNVNSINSINDNNNNDNTFLINEDIDNYDFLNIHEQLYVNKIIKGFNFILNLLEITLNNNDNYHLNYNNKNLNIFDQNPFSKEDITNDNNYIENMCNINNFIKKIINKIESFLSTNLKRKNLQNHIKNLDKEKFRNLLYDSKMMRSIKSFYEDSYFFCLEFLFLAYICSNYFSDHISKNYNLFLKRFNFNDVWLSNHQIKVKILLSLIYMFLYEINLIDLREFFIQILKIILYKFYNYLDYNDLEIYQYIFLNISNDALFSYYTITDNIIDTLNLDASKTYKEFFYIFNLSKNKQFIYQYINWGKRNSQSDHINNDNDNNNNDNNKKHFINNLFNFIIHKMNSSHNIISNAIMNKPELTQISSFNNTFIYSKNQCSDNLDSKMEQKKTKEINSFQSQQYNELCNISNINNYNKTTFFDTINIEKHNLRNGNVSNNIDNDINENISNNVDNNIHENTHTIVSKICEKKKKKKKYPNINDKMCRNNNSNYISYSFDNFLSEKGLEKNDFSFFKKKQHSAGNGFFEKVLTYINNKKSNIKICNKNEKCNIFSIKYRDNEKKNINNDNNNFVYSSKNENETYSNKENNIENDYYMILNYFKINKEIYIDRYINKKNEILTNIQQYRNRINYYGNTNTNYYKAQNFEKYYYLPEEISESNCFIFAQNKNVIRNNFILEKNNYIHVCLDLLNIIDLYMEFKVNTYNQTFYFIKNLIITCANISFSKNLTIIYINSLIRLCLFEFRMNNIFIASNILVEILNNFEKIKYYKNLIGTIFYLSGNLLLLHLNYDEEIINDHHIKNELIDKYNYYTNLKKNNSLTKNKGHKENSNTKINYVFSDTFVNMNSIKNSDKDKKISNTSLMISTGKSNSNNNPSLLIHKDVHKKINGISSHNNNFEDNLESCKLASDDDIMSIEKKKNSNFTKKKYTKKSIPLIKNQIKITDYFSNLKHDKSPDISSYSNSDVSDKNINKTNLYNKYLKKRKINNELATQINSQKKIFKSPQNVGENITYDFFDELNKKQFFLLLICFYFKQSLNYWQTDGDTIGISNGVQQKKRIKDTYFFLMCSYKFFYKSSLFLSKQANIQSYKFPFFNYELFKIYYKFYTYYKRIFIKCTNENIVNIL
ncbi:conserved Plasmodium protein, unknown function [Plasmodium yoelii]|uniref:Uncharacterized protein n=2 Tax=Plasmodium yoelii TaxID=5861 RepID=A0AAF0B523_PLAYO|nr:conserved Plasmodium protein, unknown function [Plasmodium yoelii]WBY57869.1 hypothetical protein Py17XNL_001002179 [Plasmodium yoelii yoelii]CDU84964.1 conserved Plasmodium protein, unknown function [Plasmodium yoelii]VTZ78860.1 conserved Plasmodium protein, unknown function [Plasmodium yoelii]|eukprot:XP_022813280.1 conserved Plasmodium protein, unknown function [Plasmodium yoelii]